MLLLKMTILFRYLLKQYLRVLTLCTIAFVFILLTLRLDEIARYITLGPNPLFILEFILHQIPFILPLALPISALISSTLLMQNLSKTQELTAWRASGLSLAKILSGILVTATLLTFTNFYIVSEIASESHLKANTLKSKLRSINPLHLLHNKQLMMMNGFYFNTLGSSKLGESALDVILAIPNKQTKRLNLLVAKNLQAETENFIGSNVTLITGIDGKEETNSHLLIENIQEANILIPELTQSLQKKTSGINNDLLRLPLLFVRIQEEKTKEQIALSLSKPFNEIKQIKKCLNQCYSEIARRFSLSLATFTFTLMGAAFGMTIGRNNSLKSLYFLIGLTVFFLLTYFSAKGLDQSILLSIIFYFVPHVLIVTLSLWSLNRISKGIE